MTGDRIGHYTILEKIGEGGMGAVWKAKDEKLGRTVALKFLTKLNDADRRTRFVQEARAASALNHPSIVTIHDIADFDNKTCIVMEYVEGSTLDQAIPPAGMPAPQIIRIGMQIADALGTAHRAGIVHRDLKPANIILTANDRVKLLDFGLAKVMAHTASAGPEAQTQTTEGTILGTVNYMSPEQAQGKPVDARSDIFSLGAVLYEMATGHKAFTGETTISTITAILRDDPKALTGEVPGLPRELERTISRCLKKEPDRRFQTALDVRNALEEVEAPSTPAAAVPSKKRPTVAIALGIGAVVAIAGAVWFFNNRAPKATTVTPMIVRTLQDLPGAKTQPRFSPDGNTIALGWDGGETGKDLDIYVLQLEGGKPLRITTDPQREDSPIYSRDGKRIYFSRVTDKGRVVFWVPALGGHETRFTRGDIVDFSPDGTLALVFRGQDEGARGFYLVNTVSGQETELLRKPPDFDLSSAASFSPDGKWVYLAKSRMDTVAIPIRIPVNGGSPEPVPPLPQLADKGDLRTVRFAGQTMIVSVGAGRGNASTYLIKPDGSPPVLLPRGGGPGSYSADGHKRALLASFAVMPLYRAPAFPPKGTKVIPEKVLDSPRQENTPRLSPDGSRMAIASSRNRSFGIWLWDLAFANGKILVEGVGRSVTGSPAWSPDGQWIAYDARVEVNAGDIWIVGTNGQSPKRRLTTDPGEDIVPCFDVTGQWLYFTSSRDGSLELYKMPAQGGKQERVTKGGGFTCQPSRDGKYIYYLKSRAGGGIWRLDLASGAEEPVLPEFKSRTWRLLDDGIYLLEVDTSSAGTPTSRFGEASFYRFVSKKVEKLGFITPKPAHPNSLEVSPDRKWIYYAQQDALSNDIQILENIP